MTPATHRVVQPKHLYNPSWMSNPCLAYPPKQFQGCQHQTTQQSTSQQQKCRPHNHIWDQASTSNWCHYQQEVQGRQMPWRRSGGTLPLQGSLQGQAQQWRHWKLHSKGNLWAQEAKTSPQQISTTSCWQLQASNAEGDQGPQNGKASKCVTNSNNWVRFIIMSMHANFIETMESMHLTEDLQCYCRGWQNKQQRDSVNNSEQCCNINEFMKINFSISNLVEQILLFSILLWSRCEWRVSSNIFCGFPGEFFTFWVKFSLLWSNASKCMPVCASRAPLFPAPGWFSAVVVDHGPSMCPWTILILCLNW